MVIRNLDMVNDIFTKYFDHFVNKTSYAIDVPFSHALPEAKDEHSKNIRTTISPTFNTVRLKRMYGHIESNTRRLLDHLKKKQERNEPVELKEVLSLFTMDVIASTGFGVHTDSLEDPKNRFFKESKRIMDSVGLLLLITTFLDFLKPVLKFLGIASLPRVSLDFFSRFVDVAIQERKHEGSGAGSKRHDFLQLMMEAEEDKPGQENDNMTEEEATALNSRSRSKPGFSLTDLQCAIHRDPELWPEPDTFRPERFTAENKSTRHLCAHIPFGQGPCNCIGKRLALLEMKVALAAILQTLTPVSCDQSVYPVVLEPLLMVAKGGAWVKFDARS